MSFGSTRKMIEREGKWSLGNKFHWVTQEEYIAKCALTRSNHAPRYSKIFSFNPFSLSIFYFSFSIFVFLRKIYAQVKSFAQHNHVARSTIFPFLIDDWWQLHALGMASSAYDWNHFGNALLRRFLSCLVSRFWS